MRYTELVEAPGQAVYHATKAENITSIMKKGLTFFNDSLWVRADNPDERYQDQPSVFAFENPMPAFRWAHKIEWEYDTPAIIVKLKWNDAWEQDPSPDFMMTMGDGRALVSYEAIPPGDVLGVIAMKQIGTPASTGLQHEEFDNYVKNKLEKL